MRGRHDADVHPLGAARAHRRHLAALQRAQQLGLQLGGHVADLVEEERAARGLAEAPQPRLDGTGEGAALVAEQLALEQLARDRRRVDGHEGQRAAMARCVQGARDQLLAGAALAGDQHRHVAARHAADGLEGVEQGRAASHQALARRRAPRHLAAQRAHLALECAAAQSLLDQRARLLGSEGLGQIIERAALHGFDGVLEGVLRRHDHHGDLAAARLHVVEQVEARGPGHAQVEEGDLELTARQRGERLVAARGLGHLVAGLLQRLAQHEADARLVVRHQHTGALAHASLRSGSVTRTRVPSPFSLSRCRLP